ncbi:MAG: hypothetical protein ACQKBT_12330, partial [Puniceicoccales bacterium]
MNDETFLQEPTLKSDGLIIETSNQSKTDGQGRESVIRFSNGISLELDLEGDRFLGIGKVSINGQSLRSEKLPWEIYTESEADGYGLRFEHFILEGFEQEGDVVCLRLSSSGEWMPRVQQA